MRTGERAELEAFRDFFAAAPPGGGVLSAETGGALAVRVPAWPDAVEVNRIMGLTRISQLDELAPLYDGARFWVSLDSEAGLDDELRSRGFIEGYAWQKFERGLEPFEARTELRVAEAEAPEHFGHTFAAGYGLPEAMGGWAGGLPGRTGWSCFVAYDGSAPVATGTLFAAGDAGWLGFAATLPSHRCRGAQGAILAARVEAARELGLSVLVTETGVPRTEGPGPSFRNILRSGFAPTYVRPNYAAPID